MTLLTVPAIAVFVAALVASSVHAVTRHPGDLFVIRDRTFGREGVHVAVLHVDPVTETQETVSPGVSPLVGIAIVPGLKIEMGIKPGSDTNSSSRIA